MMKMPKSTASHAGAHVPCDTCRRYILSTELVKGSCKDCAAELAAMDARAERLLSTLGEEKEDTY